MDGYLDRSVAQRAVSLGIVVLVHVALIVLILTQTGTLDAMLPPAEPVKLLASETPKPPPPPPIKPLLPPPELLPVPIPEIAVTPPPPSSSAPRAVVRVGPAGPPVSHFGAASGAAGLGVVAATTGAGGARGRGNLGDFEAAVKHAILLRKVQPILAWDRRNTCVINYTASIARDGSLAGIADRTLCDSRNQRCRAHGNPRGGAIPAATGPWREHLQCAWHIDLPSMRSRQ